MPILVALAIAVAVAGVVFGAAARHGRATDVADVRGDAASLGVNVAVRHPSWRRFVLARRDPTSETGLLLTVAVAGVAAAIVIIGVLLELVNTHTGFARIDDAAARFGARHQTPDTVDALKILTWLGSTSFVAVVVVLVGAQQYWQHRRKALPCSRVALEPSRLPWPRAECCSASIGSPT
jgi:hypothetical protein